LPDWIKFMGTAGARFAVSKQLRSSAGTWCYFQGRHILIDPGPGTLSRCFSSIPELDPEKLDAVILTHRHLDHSTDVNVIIEAMTQGTFNRRGALFAPYEAVANDEPVVFRHIRESVENLRILRERGTYHINSVNFETPTKHDHPTETYGLKFNLSRGKVSFIVDTLYFDSLIEHYRDTDLLIMNVLLFEPLSLGEIKHLHLNSARMLIEGIKPRLAVMTHFGLTMLNKEPGFLADELSDRTGVKVLAASDDLTLELDRVLAD